MEKFCCNSSNGTELNHPKTTRRGSSRESKRNEPHGRANPHVTVESNGRCALGRFPPIQGISQGLVPVLEANPTCNIPSEEYFRFRWAVYFRNFPVSYRTLRSNSQIRPRKVCGLSKLRYELACNQVAQRSTREATLPIVAIEHAQEPAQGPRPGTASDRDGGKLDQSDRALQRRCGKSASRMWEGGGQRRAVLSSGPFVVARWSVFGSDQRLFADMPIIAHVVEADGDLL